MDENNTLVEQYLDALDNAQLSQEMGRQLQDEFIKRGMDNPSLQLAYLMHPRSGTDMNDPETRGAIERLKAEVARRKAARADAAKSREGAPRASASSGVEQSRNVR